MGSTDFLPPESSHLLESKIFRNFTRLSRNKPQIILPKVMMSELMESSDSGNEKTEFVNDFECTSPAHEWRKLVNIILPVNVESLRKELFTKSKFMDDLHDMRKHYDISCSEWERSDDGELQRTIKYKMPLTPTMGFGPKFSCVTQVQTENSCCILNRLHAVDVVNSNENIPYADVFEVLVHHCLISTIDDYSMYSVFGQIRYKKSVWGVVKSRIDKNCVIGMDDFFGDLQNSLQKEFCTPPSKGKRSSRKKSALLPRQDCSSLSIQPIVNKTEAPQTVSSKVSESVQPTILIWLIIGILVAVVTLNTALLLKLWSLEKELSVESMPDYESLRFTQRTSEEWVQLLRNQQNIHETEVLKWLKVLEVAIELIQNTEKTLVELLGRIKFQDIMEQHSKDKSHRSMQFLNENKI